MQVSTHHTSLVIFPQESNIHQKKKAITLSIKQARLQSIMNLGKGIIIAEDLQAKAILEENIRGNSQSLVLEKNIETVLGHQ